MPCPAIPSHSKVKVKQCAEIKRRRLHGDGRDGKKTTKTNIVISRIHIRWMGFAGAKMLQMFSQFLFETWNWNWNERSLKLTASIKISHYRILSTAFSLPFCVCVFLKKVKYPLIIVGWHSCGAISCDWDEKVGKKQFLTWKLAYKQHKHIPTHREGEKQRVSQLFDSKVLSSFFATPIFTVPIH